MNIFRHINFEVYGESHSEHIGFILRNIKRNVKIDFDKIDELLSLRLKNKTYNTSRTNKDHYKVVSGITNNYTTSRPLIIEVLNNGSRSSDYNFGEIRPSHGDYIGYMLDKENHEYRGGGIFSGRMTVLYVIAGEICRQCINSSEINLEVYSHISKISKYSDKPIEDSTSNELEAIKKLDLQIIDPDIRQAVDELLTMSNNSFGGSLTSIIKTDYILGGYFFDNLKACLSAAMMSLPGSRAISFGEISETRALDKLYVESDTVKCDTNFNGGINGGFNNGINPIKFEVIYKAPATIFEEISSIKFSEGSFINSTIKMGGRHDSIFINRVFYAQEGLIYLIILDYMLFEGVI